VVAISFKLLGRWLNVFILLLLFGEALYLNFVALPLYTLCWGEHLLSFIFACSFLQTQYLRIY